MIKIRTTFLTVCWEEKNEDVCYHWQSPGQIDFFFYFKKKREKERRKEEGKGEGRTIFSPSVNIFKKKTTNCLTNPFLIFLPPHVPIHTGILLPDYESVKMVILICTI